MCKFCELAKAGLLGGDDLLLSTAHEAEQDTGSSQTTRVGLSVPDRVAAEKCATLKKRRLPCVILTGFLGSGKTTLLNRILTQTKLRLAVIENEVGSVSIDDKLIDGGLQKGSDRAPETIVLPNGCLCCRTRGDLKAAFKRIVNETRDTDKGRALDGIVLELSGLSELGPVVQTFFLDPFVQSSLGLDGIVCVCDASNFEGTMSSDSILIREQLSLADVVLLNKVDSLEGDASVQTLSQSIQGINSTCKIHPCSLKDTSVPLPKDYFGVDTFMKMDAYARGVQLEGITPAISTSKDGEHDHHKHNHDKLGYSTMSVSTSGLYIDKLKLKAEIETLHERVKEMILKKQKEEGKEGKHDKDNKEKKEGKEKNIEEEEGKIQGRKEEKEKDEIKLQSIVTPLVRYKGIFQTISKERYVLQGLFEHVDFFPLPRTAAVTTSQFGQFVFIGQLSEQVKVLVESAIHACTVEPPLTVVAPTKVVPSKPQAQAAPKKTNFSSFKSMRMSDMTGNDLMDF